MVATHCSNGTYEFDVCSFSLSSGVGPEMHVYLPLTFTMESMVPLHEVSTWMSPTGMITTTLCKGSTVQVKRIEEKAERADYLVGCSSVGLVHIP